MALRSPAVALLVSLCGSGCIVGSLHPAYEADSIRFDPALLGTWDHEDGRTSVVVARGPWRSYRVTVTDQSSTTELTAYETRIGPTRVLDLTPVNGLEAGPLLVPTHVVVQIVGADGRLEARPLDYARFREAVQKGESFGVDAVFDERENVLVTSATGALRAWLGRELTREGALGTPLLFTRRASRDGAGQP